MNDEVHKAETEPPKPRRVLVLFSGGWDSTALLGLAMHMRIEPHAVTFDYGQKNIKEVDYAHDTCFKVGVEQTTVKLDMSAINSALTGNNERGRYIGTSEWYVPQRNLIFVAYAGAIAETMGIHSIWYGANGESAANGFPDGSLQWISDINRIFATSNTPVRLEAPLMGMTKESVIELGRSFGFSDSDVFSGYGEADG